MTITNPRQFSSLDASDAALHGSLTNRPPSSTSVGDPIDFEAINRQVINNRTKTGYVYKESSVESTFRRQQDIAASLRIKQEAADQKARNILLQQNEQAQRQELANRIKNSPTPPEVGQPTPKSPLNQPPPSTPERQPPPSTGRLPATMNGTGARASSLVEPTATPPPAMLMERIPPGGGGGSGSGSGGNFFSSLPRSLPQAAGRFAIPGAYAAVDFGIRTYYGQPVTQAASGAVAGAIGAVAGGVVGTAIAGPVGGFIGAMVGGFVAGQASDYFFRSPPSTGTPPTETPNYPPFVGGQGVGVLYTIRCCFTVYQKGNPRVFSANADNTELTVHGPVQFIGLVNDSPEYNPGLVVIGTNLDGSQEIKKAGYGYYTVTEVDDLRNLSVARTDGYLDSVPSIQVSAPPPDNQPYYYSGTYYLNDDNTIASGTPAAGKNKGKTRDVTPGIPGNTPNSTGPYFPGHGGLAPSSTPNPTQTPSNLGGNLPGTAPTPPPLPFAEPKDAPQPRFAAAPGSTGNGSSVGYGVVGYATVTPATITPSEGYGPDGNYISGTPHPADWVANPTNPTAQPVSNPATPPVRIPQTIRPEPNSDGSSPVPKAQVLPTPPPTTPQATSDKTNQLIQQQKKDFDDQIARLITIGGILAGLTPIIQGIPDAISRSPAVQAANRKTTQGAVCEIAQPGGCLGDALDNNADRINQNNNNNTASLLDKISAGANAAQLALLELINTKLGNLLPGGISGFLTTFFEGFNKLTKWLHLDRALNIMTFVVTVQNAYFLCDSLKVVTLQMISDTLAVFGIKDKDNNPLNLNEILGHEVEELLKSMLGEQELTGMKKEWKALNRIYQAATNMLFAIQNMVFSVLQALEIIGSWNASIGNALKKYLVVGQNAFNWMNPNPNFHNNFFKFMGEALNVVTSLDFIAQSILQGRQAIDDFGKQTDELTKGIKETSDGFKPPEHKPSADAATASANASKSPTPSPEDVKSVQD